MKRSILSLAMATALVAATGAQAGEGKADQNNWERGAKDAWIDGKAEATLLFNGNLNSFDINTDVQNGKVTLTGKVDKSVDKKLAEELVEGIDGVKDVDNQLTILSSDDDMSDSDEGDMDYAKNSDTADTDTTSELVDAKIATVIKSRFLFDSDISGTDIDVDVENGVVTLTGDVGSDAEKQLAVTIAKNANDVKEVNDELKVVQEVASR
ncbi:BON domain-containing protein [Bowmanella dokdonensis]|uniref:BON domain-containing protein n=1 Tax=Bowmanella dokdonensis TaxID=751969 RepID=A0A939IT09_9ALTE|nr:BON domain-containing protein [Bowmanella dokdonensis]MBN7827714.1 BON domain-containing protein [Bowmanella dokdonensis]